MNSAIFTLETSINELADDKRLESMNLFLSDWHNSQKQRQRRLDRNPIVDNRAPTVIKALDTNLAIKEYSNELKDEKLKGFIEKRLLGTLDLLKL